MKVYIDLESGLLNNNIDILHFFFKWEERITKETKEFVYPYNPKTIAVLKDDFPGSSVLIILEEAHKPIVQKVMTDLAMLFDLNISGFVLWKDISIEQDNAYIGKYLKSIANDKNVEKVYVDYFPFSLINYFRSQNAKMVSMGFGGLFYIPLKYSFIFVPLLANWLIWWRNLNRFKIENLNGLFLTTSLFMSSLYLLRTLLELNNERVEFFKQGHSIILGEDFIYDDSNVKLGVGYMALFAILGFVAAFYYGVLVGLCGLIIAIVYGMLALSSLKTRWLILTPVIGLFGLIAHMLL